jgi:hypothetical protein
MPGLYTARAPSNKAPRAFADARCYPPTVTRPHASAPGRPRLLLPLATFVVVLVTACGGAVQTASPSASPDAAESTAPSADLPSDVPASDDPASADPGSETPSPTPLPPAAASPSTDVEQASDCTGTDENRTFYGSVAAAVDWTVYCPVLPSGWFVEAGEYRLAAGGRLKISYRGPGGARFVLEEGAWCSDGSGCVPAGSEVGTTAFGDRQGTLIQTPGGDFAVIVDAGSAISWLLTGDGLDEATVKTFGAALIAVGD